MPTYTPKTENTIQTVPPGQYKVQVEFAETKIGQQSGNEYIKMKLRVAMPDGSRGPVVFENMSFTAKAEVITNAIRESLGFAVILNEPVSVEPEELMGRTAVVKIKIDDDGYNKVAKWISPKELSAPAAKPAPKTSPAEADEIPF
jgi:hypothetical protein